MMILMMGREKLGTSLESDERELPTYFRGYSLLLSCGD